MLYLILYTYVSIWLCWLLQCSPGWFKNFIKNFFVIIFFFCACNDIFCMLANFDIVMRTPVSCRLVWLGIYVLVILKNAHNHAPYSVLNRKFSLRTVLWVDFCGIIFMNIVDITMSRIGYS